MASESSCFFNHFDDGRNPRKLDCVS